MHNQHQAAHPENVDHPREAHQHDGGDVMDEHLPKVFPFHVEKLRHAQGPVKSHREHVVPPYVGCDRLMRKSVPENV